MPRLSRPIGPVLLFVLLCCGCGSKESGGNLDDAVRAYLQLAVALGERNPASLDYYYGPTDWVAEVRKNPTPFLRIKQSALSWAIRLESRQVAQSERGRVDFLIRQLHALAGRADMLSGAHFTFEEEARALFAISLPSAEDPAKLSEIRVAVGQLLPGPRILAIRYDAFDQKFLIPADKVSVVLARAMDACRERTRQHLALPRGESVALEYVHDKPWNAYSYYRGGFHSVIQINVDFPLTVDRALVLACHEGYPGHHVFNSLQDARLVQGEHRAELMAQPAFSPQSLQSEAAATYAVDLTFPGSERLQFERDVLFPLAGIDARDAERYAKVERLVDELAGVQTEIARDFLDGKLEWVRAASQLEDKALMANSDATLKYLNEYRSYMLTYTAGNQMIKTCFARQHAEAERWKLFEQFLALRISLQDCAKIP